MTTPEKPNPKKDQHASSGTAGARRGNMRRMEYADFLQRNDERIFFRKRPAPSDRDPGPSYSFGSRYRDVDYRTPGPGSYTPMAQSDRDHGPSYSFGSRHRDVDHRPGPGPAYFPQYPSSGPKFSITSRHSPSRFAITVEEE